MSALDALPIWRRIDAIEEALAKALGCGEFDVVMRNGERFLQPNLPQLDATGLPLPMLSLQVLATRLERLLS